MTHEGRPGLGIAARALAVAALATAFVATPVSAATLKADYQFQDTRASSVSGAPELSDLVGLGGPNTFITESVSGAPRRVLAFPEGERARPLVSAGAPSLRQLLRGDARATG